MHSADFPVSNVTGRLMSDHTAIEAATRRLQAALDALEAVAERRIEAATRNAGLAEQLHALESDRARLAADLDHATARSRQLERTNREVAERIDEAMGAIRGVIAAQDG
jgi:chromosome segregation ATPase